MIGGTGAQLKRGADEVAWVSFFIIMKTYKFRLVFSSLRQRVISIYG